MTCLKLFCRALLAALVLAGGVALGAEGAGSVPGEIRSAEMTAAWQKMSLLDYAGAEIAFRSLLEAVPESRHARLGLAITRLNRPPKTNASTAAIAAELEEVRSGNPDDDLGILAEYQLARLHHVHFFPADFKEAARRYEALHTAHPGHALGQQALLRLATLELYAEWPATNADALVAKWAARKNEFRDPVVRRNFLRKLGDAILWFDLPQGRALPLFVEANEIGFARFDYRSLMLLKVYTLSVEEGFPEVTRATVRRYLEEFPRDPWTQFMRERLAELDGEGRG